MAVPNPQSTENLRGAQGHVSTRGFQHRPGQTTSSGQAFRIPGSISRARSPPTCHPNHSAPTPHSPVIHITVAWKRVLQKLLLEEGVGARVGGGGDGGLLGADESLWLRLLGGDGGRGKRGEGRAVHCGAQSKQCVGCPLTR